MTTLICCAPTRRRMAASTCAKSSWVVSRRVPGGARTCSRICPASTWGKKSRPICGNSASESTMSAMNAVTVGRACATAQDSTFRYCSRKRSKARSKARCTRTKALDRWSSEAAAAWATPSRMR